MISFNGKKYNPTTTYKIDCSGIVLIAQNSHKYQIH